MRVNHRGARGTVIQDWTQSHPGAPGRSMRTWGMVPPHEPPASHLWGSGRETSCWQDAPAMELPLNSHPLSSLGREGSTRPSWPRRSPGPRGAPRSRWPCGPPWRRRRQGKRNLEKPPPRLGPLHGPAWPTSAGRSWAGSFQTKGRRHCGGSGDREPVLSIRCSLR